MRKILSGVMAAFLAVSIIGTGYKAKAMTVDQAEEKVEKTNAEINKDIQEAVEQANDLVARYQYILVDASKFQDSQEVKDNISNIVDALNTLSQFYGSTDGKQISANITNLNSNLDLLKSEVSNKSVQKDISYIFITSIYNDFNSQLDRIILDLINKTNQKAEKLRREAAKSGIVIESEWITVNIGGRTVLVDPCRVIGV